MVRRLALGERLMANIQNKWRSTVNGVDLNRLELSVPQGSVMDLTGDELEQRLEAIKMHVTDRMPFEMVEQYAVRSPGCEMNLDEECLAVRLNESLRLSSTIFTSPAMRNESFVSAQRQCKIWWMKIFANPGRLCASEIRKESNVQRSSLRSQYPFGQIEIERFECIEMNTPALSQEHSIAIRSTMCLETATFGTLLDAIDASVDHEICLDRTIAPYQCTVVGCSTDTDPQVTRDVGHLAKYVQLLIQKSGISLINDCVPNVLKSDYELNTNIGKMDSIGVPYVLIVNESSLLQGMLLLRNRDTTLCETIHLSDVPGYLLQIFAISATDAQKHD